MKATVKKITSDSFVPCHFYLGSIPGTAASTVYRGNAIVAAKKIMHVPLLGGVKFLSFPMDVEQEGGDAESGIYVDVGFGNAYVLVSE